MEQLLTNVITNLPNFAVAFVVLWWQKQTIDQLLANQTKLIDQLLLYVKEDKARAEALTASSVVKVPKERAAP